MRSFRLCGEFKGILGYMRPYLKNKQPRIVSKTSMNQCESRLDRKAGKSPRINKLLGAWKTCLPLLPVSLLFPGHSHLLCIPDLLSLVLDKPKSLRAYPQKPPPVSSQLVGSYTCFRSYLKVTFFENLPQSQISIHPLFLVRIPRFRSGTHPRP